MDPKQPFQNSRPSVDPITTEDRPDRQPFIEPELRWIEPELREHGPVDTAAGFFGTFSP